MESFSWPHENDATDIDEETAEKNRELEVNNILRKMMGIEPKEG